MKKILSACCIVLCACGNAFHDPVQEFIPGTYVRFSESEYSKAWDTLRISVYEESKSTYIIRQQVGFQRLVKGKLQPKEYKSSKLLTVLDESTHQLQDRRTGKLYTFSPERESVMAGSAEYVKID